MSSLIRNIAFLLICLLCAAPGCDDRQEFEARREKERLFLTIDSLTSAISTAQPDAEMLRVFESSAIQKLGDFSDYLIILADTTTAPEFKEHVKKLVVEMFISENIKIPFNTPFIIYSDSSRVIKPLFRVNDSLYSGTIGFIFNVRHPEGSVPTTDHPSIGKSTIYISKKEKAFGETRRKIWCLFLGEIDFE